MRPLFSLTFVLPMQFGFSIYLHFKLHYIHNLTALFSFNLIYKLDNIDL